MLNCHEGYKLRNSSLPMSRNQFCKYEILSFYLNCISVLQKKKKNKTFRLNNYLNDYLEEITNFSLRCKQNLIQCVIYTYL